MKRASLSPDFEPVLKAMLRQVNTGRNFTSIFRPTSINSSDLADIIADHDPSHVGEIERQIRSVTDRVVRGVFRTRLFQMRFSPSNELTRRFVQEVVSAAPSTAIPLSTAWSGYMREAALCGVTRLSDAFSLALVLRRLNDWVPQVRYSAMAVIERAVLNQQQKQSVDLIVSCIDNILDLSKYGRITEDQQAVLSALIGYPGVSDAWDEFILKSKLDTAPRCLKTAIRHGRFLEELPAYAIDASHAATRRIALKVVLEGSFAWKEERTLKRRGVATGVDKDTIAEHGLSDRSVEVLRVALQHVVNHRGSRLHREEIFWRFLSYANPSISDLAAFALRRLGVDLASELAVMLETATPAPLWAARRLKTIAGRHSGALIYQAYKRTCSTPSMAWLEVAASADYLPAVDDLIGLSLEAESYGLARHASKALARSGRMIDFATLYQVASQGDELESRGLLHLIKSCTAPELVRIIAALSRAGSRTDPAPIWALAARKCRSGALRPRQAELDAVYADLSGLPEVAARAERVLGLRQLPMVVRE